MHIAAAITGGSTAIRACLENSATRGTLKSPKQNRPIVDTKRTRWLPWQCRTPSWQAAYNTACVYAALAQNCTDSTERDEMAHQAVISLIRVVNERDCEMERPWDWISNDPDFFCLKSSEKFTSFLADQKQRDYPADNKTWQLLQ